MALPQVLQQPLLPTSPTTFIPFNVKYERVWISFRIERKNVAVRLEDVMDIGMGLLGNHQFPVTRGGCTQGQIEAGTQPYACPDPNNPLGVLNYMGWKIENVWYITALDDFETFCIDLMTGQI